MLHASELSALRIQSPAATATPWRREAALPDASWFDASGAEVIAGHVGAEARGLSVAQHAERVLMHLVAGHEHGA